MRLTLFVVASVLFAYIFVHRNDRAPLCTHGTSSAGPITLRHGKPPRTTPIHMNFCQR